MNHLKRPSVDALDSVLGKPYPVLDHGFVRLVDYMGDEAAVVQAARVSYGAGTKTPSDDRALIRYLMKHRHTSPLEMCEIKVHMKLPIFVARQWIRHRTASVNEYSARYSILANEFYVPGPEDVKPQSKTNKQGRDGDLPENVRWSMLETIRQHSEMSYQIYEEMSNGWPWLDEAGDPWSAPDLESPRPHQAGRGMARELARTVLPVNVYTEWYWKVNLHNLLHLLKLRTDLHAQSEIRAYADVLARIVGVWCPAVWEAFEDYSLFAETFSRQEMDLIRQLLGSDRDPDYFERLCSGAKTPFTGREMQDFRRKVGFPT